MHRCKGLGCLSVNCSVRGFGRGTRFVVMMPAMLETLLIACQMHLNTSKPAAPSIQPKQKHHLEQSRRAAPKKKGTQVSISGCPACLSDLAQNPERPLTARLLA